MPLEDTVDLDLKNSMKAGEKLTLSTLRLLKNAFMNHKIKTGKNKLDDDDCYEIIQNQVKQRHDSIACYERAGRQDLALKEAQEIQILSKYLPPSLSDDELQRLIQTIVQRLGCQKKAEMGKIMKELMPQIKGRADGKKAQAFVSALLQ